MATIYSFPPIATPEIRVLILGSMPGEMSLRQQQYYAHRQNAFWPIMRTLLDSGEDSDACINKDYAKRCAILSAHGVGVWDVLASCDRLGSLDSAILKASIQANDFNTFYAGHRHLAHVFFNGAKAEETYRRYVLPQLAESDAGRTYQRLPSTSPANASMAYTEKLACWQAALLPCLHPT